MNSGTHKASSKLDPKLALTGMIASLLFLILFFQSGTDPFSQLFNSTFIFTVILLLLPIFKREFTKKHLVVAYIVGLTVILMWLSVFFFHVSAPLTSDYGTIGFPIQFYSEHVPKKFTPPEFYLNFTIDYLIFASCAIVSYFTIRKNQSFSKIAWITAWIAGGITIYGFWYLLGIYN